MRSKSSKDPSIGEVAPCDTNWRTNQRSSATLLDDREKNFYYSRFVQHSLYQGLQCRLTVVSKLRSQQNLVVIINTISVTTRLKREPWDERAKDVRFFIVNNFGSRYQKKSIGLVVHYSRNSFGITKAKGVLFVTVKKILRYLSTRRWSVLVHVDCGVITLPPLKSGRRREGMTHSWKQTRATPASVWPHTHLHSLVQHGKLMCNKNCLCLSWQVCNSYAQFSCQSFQW